MTLPPSVAQLICHQSVVLGRHSILTLRLTKPKKESK
jgi:hypothetical protein